MRRERVNFLRYNTFLLRLFLYSISNSIAFIFLIIRIWYCILFIKNLAAHYKSQCPLVKTLSFQYRQREIIWQQQLTTRIWNTTTEHINPNFSLCRFFAGYWPLVVYRAMIKSYVVLIMHTRVDLYNIVSSLKHNYK